MESKRIALGLVHVLVCCLVDGCTQNPIVNGSTTDISLWVANGDGFSLQCTAPYPVKWIRMGQKDPFPIVYELSELVNDTMASTRERMTPGNYTSILQVDQMVDDPSTIPLYSCVASDSLSNLHGVLPPSKVNGMRMTKVHVHVKKAIRATILNDNCLPVPKKLLTGEALLQTLNGDLLASKSATMTLEKWCGDHKLAPVPKIVAKQMNVGQTPQPLPSLAQALLRLNSTDSVRYRSVQLSCGDKVLSVADNWYVPQRLTPEMNYALDNTDTPFGKVVAPFQPFRQTSSVQFLWRPLPVGWEMNCRSNIEDTLDIPDRILEHQAVVCTKDGLPISFVDERYTNSMFDFL